jgi:signal transduction histidine kinase
VYAVTARLGLLLDAVGGFATVVWAPTGIAIAAVLILGYRTAIAVWLGAFVANLFNGPPIVAAIIAVGNTLEAVLAVYALKRVPGFHRALERVPDVIVFALVAAVIAPVVSATVGVTAVHAAGFVARSQLVDAWRSWWFGDCVGALLVAPLVIVWRFRGTRDMSVRRAREAAAIFASLVIVSGFVFLSDRAVDRSSFFLPYLVFPVLIWAAMRFEQRGAVTAVVIVSVIALVATARGQGPFVRPELHDSLFAVQTFMGIVAVCFLIVATAIAERTRAQHALVAALAAEGVANRAKSDFIASMSHELRTPLNAISGYAQLLDMEVHGPLTAAQRDAVARIERNQQHLASLVTDVLSFTRAEAGRFSVRLSRVMLADVIRALPQFIGPELHRKRLALDIDSVEDDLAVQADPDKLRQILLNLVANAIKYTDDGGQVEVAAARNGDNARIVIRDTGIGIPKDQIDRVFEPFFQVDRGHTRRYSGVGLGLTISRDLARAMGGDIELASEPGKGTAATLVLPLA